MKDDNVKIIATTGIVAAVISVLAPISLPTHPVPFSLQTLIIMFVAVVFPLRISLPATIIYIFFIAIGLPVAAGWNGGVHLLTMSVAGKTGGFIWSFLLIPPIMWLTFKLPTRNHYIKTFIGGTIAMLSTFIIGSTWFYFSVLSEWASPWADVIAWTVSPFIIISLLKVTIVSVMSIKAIEAIKRARIW